MDARLPRLAPWAPAPSHPRARRASRAPRPLVQGLKERYERHHCVAYTEEALAAAVALSHKYIADRFLPDKVRHTPCTACPARSNLCLPGGPSRAT